MKNTVAKRIVLTLLAGVMLLGGCGAKDNTGDDTVTLEQIYRAQDRETLVEYYGDALYEFSVFYKEEEVQYSQYYTGNDIFLEEYGDTFLYRDSLYCYFKSEGDCYATMADSSFDEDIAEFDNYLFGEEEDWERYGQQIVETSLNADNLKVVAEYQNRDFVKRTMEEFDFTYDESCVMQSTYILDANTLAMYAGEDKLIFSDGTEYVFMKYSCSYGYQKNVAPEQYLELLERMDATESVTEYTVVYKGAEEHTRKMKVVKGDIFILQTDEEPQGIFYDEEGTQPVEGNVLSSEADSLTIYVME